MKTAKDKKITKKKTATSKKEPVKHEGPRIITLACTKGGVGKSTIAFNLAVELSKKNKVTVIDLDYQKTLTIFDYNRRGLGLDPFNLLPVKGRAELKSALTKTKEIIIIDTHAVDSDVTRLAMIAADVILTPTTDGHIDLCGLLAFKDVLHEVQTTKKAKAYVIVNRLAPKSNGYRAVENFVENHKDCFAILDAKLYARQEYRDAFEQGKSVCELIGKRAVSDEFKKLLKEIESL